MQSVVSVADESLEQALDFEGLEEAFAHAAAATVISGCRSVLNRIKERLKQRFFGGAPVEEIVGLRAVCIDEVVRRAWHHWGLGDSPHALLAVGGYGRGELHPYSDVDICIVLGAEIDDLTRERVEKLITFLWDVGLEVGHSVRSVAECVSAARDDITIMTNLMEARLVAGPVALLEAVRDATDNRHIWPTDLFFKAKMEEQERRHSRFNDAFQQLEPNIKESPGGLRDIQIIAWVANRHFHTAGLRGLIDNGFLTAQEYEALVRGRAHLWRIRCALHYLAGRREDRLLFDYQRLVSQVFGFAEESHTRAVEQFMRGFYRTVRELGRLNEMLLGLFQEAILHPDREARASPLNRRFQVRGNYIEVTSDQVFKRSPPALLEIFLLIQLNPSIKGVRASTIRLIREHLYLIDDKFRRDIRARSLFMEIIRQPRRIGHELQRMHRYGVLAAYLPEFARIEGLMQFDLFHVYTVDEHLLFVLQMMRRFSYPVTEEDQPNLIRQAIERIPKLELLYISGLYHDVGKGSGRDHSVVGAEEVTAFCQAHGLSNYDTRLVAWLVDNHLAMSATAQREDIYDPDVIQRFAGVVSDETRLDYLFLLTIADIRGTNPQLWTSWKRSLLFELYLATLRALRSGVGARVERADRTEATRQEARKLIETEEFPEHTVSLLWSTLSEEYFLRHRPVEIAWHSETILGADDDDLPLIAIRNFDSKGGTSVFIYALDTDYLFAIATATLDRLRLDVQDARIITSSAGYTLDTFTVLDAETRSVVSDPERIHDIQSRLRSALRARELVPVQTTAAVTRRLRNFSVPASVNFSHDTVHDRTIMEVIATDRPGFLSVVGRAMQHQGVRLHDARISTIGERAEDYFYVTDLDNRPFEDPPRQEALRSEIIAGLND